jgi:hypothetical protein
LSAVATSAHATFTFTTFVNGTDISNAIGQNNTIGFAYVGNKFVGSVYEGTANFQLYQTNLTGGNVTPFGTPMPNGNSGETVLGGSLGLGGFPVGNVYASPASNVVYQYANSGGTPSVFATLPGGTVIRQIFFDPGSSFGGDMLVTTTSGTIYKINSSGTPTAFATTNQDSEGMDIATSNLGKYAGDLLVTSEGTGTVWAVTPGGVVTPLSLLYNGNPTNIEEAETVSVVPLNLGVSGNPLEGFYVANYPENVQMADAAQFAGLQGDIIVTSEDSVDSPVWLLTYNGDTAGTFNVTKLGTLPNQSEDGEFVTAQRIADVSTPEPASLLLLSTGAGALGWLSRRRRRRRT